MSTVDDLAVWSDAVFSGRLVRKEWLDRAFTPFALADGESSGYGYGWFVGDFAGHRSIEHGGGINGFTSYELTLPEDKVFVAILTNSAVEGRDPEPRAVEIAWLALGLAEPERKAVTLAAGDLDAIAGVYANERKQEYWFSREGAKLFAQRQGGAKNELYPASPTEFFLEGQPGPVRVRQGRRGPGDRAPRPVPDRSGPGFREDRQAPPLSAAGGQRSTRSSTTDLAGDYELAPNFIISIIRRGDKLISQATGQSEVEIFPESELRFFLKVVDAQVDFVVDASGRVTGLVLHQGGRDLPARKIKKP